MASRTVRLAQLVDENHLLIGAGRPRSEGGHLPVLRVADVLDGHVHAALSVDALAAQRPDVGPKASRPGDIVLTTKGTVGRVAIMPSYGPTYAYSPQLCYFRVLANDLLAPRYLYYWLKSAEFRMQADAVKAQTDMADFISLQDVYSLAMRLPPVDEQKAIAEVLGALDDKIAGNERIVSCADELADALTRRAFSGETVSLVDVASVTMGSSPPGTSYNEVGNGKPFFQGVRDFGVRFPSRRVWTDKPVRLASVGDTLLSVRAPVGKTNLAVEELCIGRGLAALRSRDGRAMSLFHQVRAGHGAWAPYEAEGTVFGAISRAQLESIDLPAVDESDAAELEDRLIQLETLIASALRESSSLASTRDELLPLLMSGKVRVKDAEKAVEGVL